MITKKIDNGWPEYASDATLHQIAGFARTGLQRMFDSRRQLFCHRLRLTTQGLVREGLSRRYTLITLMGLSRLEASGTPSPIELKRILDCLLLDLSWVDNIGDLGLLLWLCAEMSPERLAAIGGRLPVAGALGHYQDAKHVRTMELAWFLAGLSHWGLACPEKLPKLRDLALDTYKLMKTNQTGRGSIFGHSARSKSLSGIARGRIGSFADQVYPIYAMTKFSQAYSDERSAQDAFDTALALCEHQGPLGQWWWHYDSSSSDVSEDYPVFSVHQHGMGPMTLFELGETIGYDFGRYIYKGLQWIDSANELSVDMADPSRGVIWRCIYRPRLRRLLDVAFRPKTDRREKQPLEVRVLFECRPYELGWFFYAFAGRTVEGLSTALKGEMTA